MDYDYIIIGAGSSGCVLAHHLSADKSKRVALLEAGGRDISPWIHIPVGYFKTMGNPVTDWCLATQPDAGLNGRSIHWPRGRVLGGSSSINGLLYVRGQAEDYDHWRRLGNKGWGWADVLPYFKRAEDWQGAPSPLRGTGGPLTVSENQVHRDIIARWLESALAAGYTWVNDYNGTTQEGVGYYQLTMRNGMRCSSAAAYLKPIRGRKNLDILTHAQALKILIKDRRATGIEARIHGIDQTLTARAEIILCAGAIGSPHLLMLSGIGDAHHLKQKGIEPYHHLPGVGKNLQDHLQARPVYKCTASTLNIETRNPLRLLWMAMQYAATRTGPMTMAASLGAGFIKSHKKLKTPDLQFHIQPFSADNPAEGAHKFSAFTASILQLRPTSTGHLALKTPHPLDLPAIHPNYLATDLDCQTIIEGVKRTRQICAKPPVAALITDEHAPGKGVTSDAQILQWVRDTATTIYHPTGTAKMGVDKMSVVDAELRVKGVMGLRVADASIMPQIISGNTNAACIMIAEKLSDMMIKTRVKPKAGRTGDRI